MAASTTRSRVLILLALAAAAGAACDSGGGGARDAGSGGGSGDGAAGAGGAGGAGGVAGAGGAGGGGAGGAIAPSSCPQAPPTAGGTCVGTTKCFYEDCAGAGRTVATCASSAWTVETGACAPVYCVSRSCAAGQICVQSAGGALLISCVDNTCGPSPIACGCLPTGTCTSSCSFNGSSQSGLTIYCNTCPSGLCP